MIRINWYASIKNIHILYYYTHKKIIDSIRFQWRVINIYLRNWSIGSKILSEAELLLIWEIQPSSLALYLYCMVIIMFFFYLHIFSAAGVVSPHMIPFNNRPKRKTEYVLWRIKKNHQKEINYVRDAQAVKPIYEPSSIVDVLKPVV